MSQTTVHEDSTKMKHRITVKINNKHVQIEKLRLTGYELKEAAIAHGINIQLDFQLAEIKKHGEHDIVGDDELVTVSEHSKFIATACDDNSDEVPE